MQKEEPKFLPNILLHPHTPLGRQNTLLASVLCHGGAMLEVRFASVISSSIPFAPEEYEGAAVCLARISALPSAYFMRQMGVNGVNWFRGRSIRSNLERRAFELMRRLLNFQVAEAPQQYNDVDAGNDDAENVLMIEEPPIQD